VLSSDLPGVNPATPNEILLYYRLMTKRSGLGDSTKLSRVGLSHHPRQMIGHNIKFLEKKDPTDLTWFGFLLSKEILDGCVIGVNNDL
jgi:hypothetical protein